MSSSDIAAPGLSLRVFSPAKTSPFMTEASQQTAVATTAFDELQLPASALTATKMKKTRKALKVMSSALLRFSCFGGSTVADIQFAGAAHSTVNFSAGVPSNAKSKTEQHQLTYSISPRKASYNGKLLLAPSLRQKLSCNHSNSSYFSDAAEWHDTASQFSGNFDQYQAGVEEVVQVVKELESFTVLAPWVPNPPLAFGTPDMRFVPVPAVTGFAGYWLRDDTRTTPFPQPIDLMLKASLVAKKVHESIPGILMKESPTEFEIIANPAFMPKFLGFNGYAEKYDKSNKVEHSWAPRRDLKMGKGYGKLYMTADGMLIARVWQKPAFSDKVDVIMEEYMRLEDGGNVIVDTMTCLHVESGKRATQLQVGIRRPAP